MRPKLIKEVLRIAIPRRRNILLVSEPGVGKTSIVTQMAMELDHRMVLFHPVTSDPTDFKGFPWVFGVDHGQAFRLAVKAIIDGQKGKWSEEQTHDFLQKNLGKPQAEFIPFGDLRRLIETTVPTVAFLDDLGQALTGVQAATMQLLHGGKINGHQVSEKVSWLAATNRRQDFAGVQGLLEPVKSRFMTILHLDVHIEDWSMDFAYKNDIAPQLIAFLNRRPDLLLDFKPSKDMVNTPNPRNWESVSHILTDGYPADAQQEMITGAVGEGAAVEFAAFEQLRTRLVNPKVLLAAPDTTPIPDDEEPDALYALCASLISIVEDKNFDAVVKVACRMSAEFSTYLISGCTARFPKLMKAPAFKNWAIKYQDYLT